MLTLEPNCYLVESASELPQFAVINTLYADFETSSGDKRVASYNPHLRGKCYVAGLAISHDANPNVYYIQREHLRIDWLRDILQRAKRWTNHNVKYDAHVAANCCGIVLGVDYECELDCTLTGSKLIDSDRLASRDLGTLSLDWLHTDISRYENALHPYTVACGNKDYGRIPHDKLGLYACVDVRTNRQLARYIDSILDQQASEEEPIEGGFGTHYIQQLERDITRICFEMERNGMLIEPQEVFVKKAETILRMIEIGEQLRRLTGREVNPSSNAQMFDLLITQYGLPILKWTLDDDDNERGASFDKHAMQLYAEHVDSPPEVIALCVEYRTLSTFKSLFLTTFIDLHDRQTNLLHGTINQIVRTGRCSMSEPNGQQQNDASKLLIHPPKSWSICDDDYSQIEFRQIVHFINAENCIRAYNANPDEDFHRWVAELCGVKRSPAKTINFMSGYGGGKKKLVTSLSNNRDVAAEIEQYLPADLTGEPRKRMALALRRKRGEDVYDTYHRTLPTLKSTAKVAERVARRQGYVRTWYGRRRHLSNDPENDMCWLAFNTVCQGSAADLFKERLRALWNQIRSAKLQSVIRLTGMVHDSILRIAPTEIATDPRFARDTLRVLEFPARPLRVPVRCTYGTSANNWCEAAHEERRYPRSELSPVNDKDGEQLFTWV